MQRATLYLMVGYPGSGKTTTSRIIRDLTGAQHIWADHVRKAMFGTPTHSHEESRQLYDRLNKEADQLIAEGKSVVYDTNFNFYKDRQLMRDMAQRYDAEVKLVWVQTPKEVAFERASIDTHKQATRVLGDMPKEEFDRMIHNLEPPAPEEEPIVLDGTQITPAYVANKLGLST
ncbi:MAG: uncharacterized protein JWP13_210 [Candidatus Saccharibacteria bacterium]|nr:uncharacterized protein [Candidatus Saccharibacteria bacterium]